MYVCMCALLCAFLYGCDACMFAFDVCIYKSCVQVCCACISIYICVYIYIYIYMCVCVCVYVRVFVRMRHHPCVVGRHPCGQPSSVLFMWAAVWFSIIIRAVICIISSAATSSPTVSSAAWLSAIICAVACVILSPVTASSILWSSGRLSGSYSSGCVKSILLLSSFGAGCHMDACTYHTII